MRQQIIQDRLNEWDLPCSIIGRTLNIRTAAKRSTIHISMTASILRSNLAFPTVWRACDGAAGLTAQIICSCAGLHTRQWTQNPAPETLHGANHSEKQWPSSSAFSDTIDSPCSSFRSSIAGKLACRTLSDSTQSGFPTSSSRGMCAKWAERSFIREAAATAAAYACLHKCLFCYPISAASHSPSRSYECQDLEDSFLEEQVEAAAENLSVSSPLPLVEAWWKTAAHSLRQYAMKARTCRGFGIFLLRVVQHDFQVPCSNNDLPQVS